MSEQKTSERLDRVLGTVDAARRDALRKILLGSAYAVPVIASFSVPELASGQIGSEVVATSTVVTVT